MRICDRCHKGPVKEIWQNKMDGTEVDLCGECSRKWADYVNGPKEAEETTAPVEALPTIDDTKPLPERTKTKHERPKRTHRRSK